MNSHFAKHGVIIGHLNWKPEGGHYFLIIGGASHNNTYYLHVLDSNCSSTITRVQCYDFSSFKTLPTNTANGVLDYWIPMDKFDSTYRTYNGVSAKIYFDGAYYTNMSAPTTLEFRNVVYPSTYNTGSKGFNLSGGVIVSDAELTSINAWIEDSNGTKISKMSSPFPIFGHCYPIRDIDGRTDSNNKSLDMGQKFSYIQNPGKYKWVLTATDEAGRALKLEMPIDAVSSGSTVTDKAGIVYKKTVPVSAIEIEDPGTMYPGASFVLNVTIKPEDATNRTLDWASSDTSVVTVDSSGKLTAAQKGTAIITASATDGSGVRASITVWVKPIDEMSLEERIKIAILYNLPYEKELDLNDDGAITALDYVLAVKFGLGIEINEKNFPDPNFRYVIAYFDKNGNGCLSEAELETVEEISCPGLSITNLTGIEHFTSLKVLHCYDNQLTWLDISALVHLVELDCSENPLTALNVTKNHSLKTLICGNTYLDTIDLSNCPSLSQLMCEQYCYGWKELKSIVVSACPLLDDLVTTTTYADHTIPGHLYLYNHMLHGWWKENSDGTLAEYCFVGPDVVVSTTKGEYIGDKKKPEPENKIEAFVTRCYTVILGRKPDEAGLKAWAKALENGEAQASQIIDGFVNSPEFLNKGLTKSQQVEVLYRAMLGRAPDPAGLSAWTEVLNQGYPFGSVINGFCGSMEFINLCNEYGIKPGSVNVGPVQPAQPTADMEKIRAFVARCYSIILGRGVDTTGLNDWSNLLATGKAQASQIIDGIVNSDEFKLRNLSNEQKVEVLYLAMLDRGADPAGKAAWVQALADGHPYGVIINGFCGSIEFKAICDKYGIQPGSVKVKSALVKRVSIEPEGADPAAPVIRVGYNSEYINEEKIRTFVKHCYESVLEREGDAEGVENYTSLILNGKKTPKRVAYEFVFSPEFQGKLPGNEELIRILYKLYLNRDANAEEVAGWVAMLDGGAGLEEVVTGFAESAEFRAIVKAMKE